MKTPSIPSRLRQLRFNVHHALAVFVARHIHGRPATYGNVLLAKHTLRTVWAWITMLLGALTGALLAWITVNLLFAL